MPNAKSAEISAFHRFLLVGRTGTGKSAQIWTLPGKKFAYIFDPNSMITLKGCDLEYEEFYPEFTEMDATLKGFNKNAKSDKPASAKEPLLYMNWVEDINKKVDDAFFEDYDWLCIDSLTFLVKAMMDRQMFINNRYGDIEDLGDYRVVGSKMADIFGSISGLQMNLFCTGHIDSFQDEKTKKIETQLKLPGKARGILPLQFTDILQTYYEDGKYFVRTKPEPRGLQDIRTSIPGLKEEEDVTIPRFDETAVNYGIGALLRKSRST